MTRGTICLALFLCIGTWGNADAKSWPHYYDRSFNAYSPFCGFSADYGRMCHGSATLRHQWIWFRGAYGADLVRPALPSKHASRQRVQSPGTIHSRQLELPHIATAPRLATSPAGAEPKPDSGDAYKQLRFDVLKACLDQVDEFVKEKNRTR